MPALPLHAAGKYVAGAYIVFFALVLIYVAIMASRLRRIERELGEVLELASRRAAASANEQEGEYGAPRSPSVGARVDARDALSAHGMTPGSDERLSAHAVPPGADR